MKLMDIMQEELQDIVKPIYSGKPENFHWVGFGSGSGTNLEACAKIIPPAFIFSDKDHPKLFDLKIFENTRKESINGFKFVGSRKKAEAEGEEAIKKYHDRCIDYNYAIANRLKEISQANNYNIDLIVLGGYMRLVTEPLLSIYKDKIINVHPADLSIFVEDKNENENNKNLERKFIGADAVYDAILAGQKTTRSTTMFVDDGEDHGEILTQGNSIVVQDYRNLYGGSLRRYVDEEHQPMQKKLSDWPSLTYALKLIQEGKIGLGTKLIHNKEWRAVYIKNAQGDWLQLPYEGLRIIK